MTRSDEFENWRLINVDFGFVSAYRDYLFYQIMFKWLLFYASLFLTINYLRIKLKKKREIIQAGSPLSQIITFFILLFFTCIASFIALYESVTCIFPLSFI